ncbi:MAG: DUF2293 domain-containing protein [Proteobacteria bacterium]|nr:DUF2293 domain-containing protein [Pseudomonadota bacterium]
MPEEIRTVKPGRKTNTVITESGEELVPPASWELLPPGDGALTKLVKAKGPTWLVQVKVGRRVMSRGIWASKDDILAAARELTAKRTAPGYDLQRGQQKAAREKKHQLYVKAFYQEVLQFLDFHPCYNILAVNLAERVTALATPVGSGTVARTERIPLCERARAAVIAWLRHQVTSYDKMAIARVKGRRREVRRELAAQSMKILIPYRLGKDLSADCPLYRVLTTNDKVVEGVPPVVVVGDSIP